MDAGREFDALVAERVMELRPGKDFGVWPDHDWHEVDIDDWRSELTAIICRRCDKHGGWVTVDETRPQPCTVTPPEFSVSIAAAWPVAEHLRLWVFPHEGRWYAGRINAEAYIDILPADIHALAPLSDRAVVDGRFAILEGADTAPLAICRAALAAVGAATPV